MAQIKSAREIAMEKSKKIDKLSLQEMADMKEQEKINAILAKYYKDKIEADDLWHHLKGVSRKYLLKAEKKFLQSLTFQSNNYDLEKRKKGILAIENLKKSGQYSDIEYYIQQFKKIKDDFIKNKEQLMQKFKEELDRDPQKRLQTFQQGNQVMIKQLSLEEALEQNQQSRQQLQQLEKQYKKQFSMVKEKLSDIISD
ncbi:MAG: hypothetical protein ACOC6D_00180 [Atribacterota bacterium]